MTIIIGVVAFGKMGILHSGIVNALEDNELVSVCERYSLLRRMGTKLLENVYFHCDISEMLRNANLDAIFVTTPIVTHQHLNMKEGVTNTASQGFLQAREVRGRGGRLPVQARAGRARGLLLRHEARREIGGRSPPHGQ